MPDYKTPTLKQQAEVFSSGKEAIVQQWVKYELPREVLQHHHIDTDLFAKDYASNVFDYFIAVVRGEQAIGDCPVMAEFLNFLKDRDVSSDELFVICNHFRKSMIDFTYTNGLESRELIDEISLIFDRNFTGVLKMYSDRLYEKERELEKSLKLLNEYKRAIDESALVSKTDLNGVITYVNDNLVQACGYDLDELIGQSHNIIRHEDMTDEFFHELWQTIRNKEVFKGTIKNRKKNGDHFYVDATLMPILDAHEEISEYIAISYEVTKLVDARQKAVEAGQAKEYFLSNMSHEIRTPLNAILGFVSILLDDQLTSKQKKYLDIVQKSGESLLSIINDILDFSKLRSGEFTIDSRAFVLHEELSQTLELFAAPANEKDITLLSFIDPSIPYELIADPLRIKQIIANLLSNAIKFTPYGGKVEMEVQCPKDGELVISVRDNGIGISEEDQERIFNAFAQTQNSSTYLYGGTGLGLSICMQLAKHMGGTISVASELEKGSTFTLRLPVKASESCSFKMFNPEMFQSLRVCLLQSGKEESQKVSLLKRYWEVFDMKVETIHSIEDRDCDLLFFVDNDVDDLTRSALITQEMPTIAIMDDLKEIYDDVKHIAPLYFPIYCAKLYNAFLSAMQMTASGEKVEERKQTMRQFKGRVLVAEDNIANQELIKIMLHRYGIEYVVVPDGLEALNLYKSSRFDMILMDEQMPRMNGIDATKKIIAYEDEHQIRHTPIVALTANVIKGAKERGLMAGYDAFLGKPIVIKELEKVFEKYLDESDVREIMEEQTRVESKTRIRGIDEAKLLKELMLDPDELMMLMEVFLNKMQKTLPELERAIERMDYEETARLAHSIKGSSANFRIKSVQSLSKQIEDAAMHTDKACDYNQLFVELKEELSKVYIDV